MAKSTVEGVQIVANPHPLQESILTPDALTFLAALHRRFNKRRLELLDKRAERQVQINKGTAPDFLPETSAIRNDPSWRVAPTPPDLQHRNVEITGPTEKKMMINALNSGAQVFMADFEDSLSPTWINIIDGQNNLRDAIAGSLKFTSPEGKSYALRDKTAVLMVRPRGWHLFEKHLLIDDEQISGSLFDFGLYFFHNANNLLKKGSGPYFYLPKMESHLEARLWNDVFNFAEETLALPSRVIRATVLIETILAAFEMEEILYELRDHISGLNAGRWDYLFSIIKKFKQWPQPIFPDRSQVTMKVPFMRAYTELLVRTCHKRGAHAMGGMSAFIPSRKDVQVNEVAMKQVQEDKIRESNDGFDGTWVAHPDLVSVAFEIFERKLEGKPHQKDRLREDVRVKASDLLDCVVPGGKITEKGMRQNINVAIQYIDSWLRGVGAAALFNLMEDAATAEIARSQLWQWVHHPLVKLDDGRIINEALYKQLAQEEFNAIVTSHGLKSPQDTLIKSRQLLDSLVLDGNFADFLTTIAYEWLE